MTRAASPPAAPLPLWSRGWFWLALAALSAAPFLFTPLPMLPDWFSHVGRYHVMNASAGDPWLPLYYRFDWTLIGNLGVDLLMVPLGPLFGTERAAHLIAGLIPPLTVGGVYALGRAAGARLGPAAFAALPLLYALPFALGFLNFGLAMALAFWAAAGWLRVADRPVLLRWAVGLAVGAAVWIAHVAGWGILVVLVGCLELAAAIRGRGLSPAAFLRAAARSSPLLLPLVPTFLWRAGGAAPIAAQDFSMRAKAFWLENLFRGESPLFDLASTILVLGIVGLLLFLLVRRRAVAAPGLLGAGLVLLLLFAVLPQWLFGSYYADMRLLPAALILILVAISPHSRRVALAVGLAGLALFGARIAVTSAGWHQRGGALARDLAVLDRVPRGSRIAVMAHRSACVGWTPSGFDHAPSLAIVRRHAFVNSEWDYGGSHLMKPVYNQGRDFNAVPSNLVAGPIWPCDGRPLAAMLAALPRDRFDFVWMFEMEPPPGSSWLEPVAAGPNGRLYRIRRADGAGRDTSAQRR